MSSQKFFEKHKRFGSDQNCLETTKSDTKAPRDQPAALTDKKEKLGQEFKPVAVEDWILDVTCSDDHHNIFTNLSLFARLCVSSKIILSTN